MMLVKAGTSTAQAATFNARDPRQTRSKTTPDPARELQDRIAGLEQELARMKAMLVRAEEQRVRDVAAATSAGRANALEEFRRDEEQGLLVLRAAVADALSTWKSACDDILSRETGALAGLALSRLVDAQEDELVWLRRLVATTANRVRDQAVVAVKLPPAQANEEQIARLRQKLPPGTAIECDTTLPSGSARIVLRLGVIDISPKAGLEELHRILTRGVRDAV